MRTTRLALLLLLSVAGCSRLGFEAASGPRDDGTPTMVDGPSGPLDSVPDGPAERPDAANDLAPKADAVPVVDAGVALAEGPFLVPDSQPKDAPVSPQPTPCSATAATKVFGYAATMVICQATTKENQCSAGKLCNAAAGWKACGPSEFLARGGASTPTQTQAWIGSCVRNAALPAIPADGSCTVCSQLLVNKENLTWNCSGGLLASSDLGVLGLTTASSCHRVGINSATTAGYWDILGSEKTLDATVCCK